MGRRSSTDTLVRVFQCFWRKREWTQAQFAEEVGIAVPSLRKRLAELCEHGVPLTREEQGHQVVWRAAEGWMPGAVIFGEREMADLLRVLLRAPKDPIRERLRARVMEAGTGSAAREGAVATAAELTPDEARWLPVVEDAALRRVPLLMRYRSASGDAEATWRTVSVQRVVAEQRPMLIGRKALSRRAHGRDSRAPR